MNIHKTTTFIIIPLYHSVLARMHVCIPTSDVTVTYTVHTYILRMYVHILYGVSDPSCTCACKMVQQLFCTARP